MLSNLRIPSPLRRFTNGESSIKIRGTNIREVLDELFHAHPDKPSEFDREHAWPGFSYIIISVQDGKAVSYRSWQLNEDRKFFIEENIKIVKEEIKDGK